VKLSYGLHGQVHFSDAREYYYALGFLASAKRTSLHWEHNEEQGAWGSEGRIHCYKELSLFPPSFIITAGTGTALGRINCNDYVTELVETHHFTFGRVNQDITLIMSTVPNWYRADFLRGVAV